MPGPLTRAANGCSASTTRKQNSTTRRKNLFMLRSCYPAILACWNSEEGQRSLVVAVAPPSCLRKTVRSLKSPTGAFVAAQTRACLGRQNRLITPPTKRNRAFPTGNALLCISLLSVVFGRVRLGGRTLFFYYASSFSARSIRYPTPTWVWIRCGASGYRSNFLRRDAI